MLKVSEVMSLMVSLRSDVWTLWGLLATFNTALIGWLLGMQASLGTSQKVVATAGYLLFCAVIAIGFSNAYTNLSAAQRDLDQAVKCSEPCARGGLVETFLTRDYRDNKRYALGVTGLCFVLISSLLWGRWL